MVAPIIAALGTTKGLATIGSLAGGLFGNSARRKEAAKDRAFQLQMAKNAHQYEVADLLKAGLNPILSGTGGPGARASGGSKAEQSDPITPAINSALAVSRNQQEIENLKAQEQNTRMDTALKSTQINAQQSIAPLNQAQEKKLLEEAKKVKAETATEAERLLTQMEVTKRTKSEAELKKLEATIEKWMYDNGMTEFAKLLGAGGDSIGILRMLQELIRGRR